MVSEQELLGKRIAKILKSGAAAGTSTVIKICHFPHCFAHDRKKRQKPQLLLHMDPINQGTSLEYGNVVRLYNSQLMCAFHLLSWATMVFMTRGSNRKLLSNMPLKSIQFVS